MLQWNSNETRHIFVNTMHMEPLSVKCLIRAPMISRCFIRFINVADFRWFLRRHVPMWLMNQDHIINSQWNNIFSSDKAKAQMGTRENLILHRCSMWENHQTPVRCHQRMTSLYQPGIRENQQRGRAFEHNCYLSKQTQPSATYSMLSTWVLFISTTETDEHVDIGILLTYIRIYIKSIYKVK